MADNTLPPEIFPIIFQSISNPIDWINCMQINTSWYNILLPLYLDTDFRIVFLNKSDIPRCLRESCTIKKCKITNPALVYYHFLFDSSTPVFTVKGLYLPFVKSPTNGERDHLVFSYGKYMEHYTFKFPITQNSHIFQKIQQISLNTPKFTKSKINYHQILLSEFNQYYTSNPHLKDSSKYHNDLSTIKRFEKYPYTKGCHEMSKLKYYFSQNHTRICPFCHDTHRKLI
jgi:hypothetical protein